MTNSFEFETGFIFETDHKQYMSLAASPETFIPPSLELRARAALKELADIKREFELHSQRYEQEVKDREEKFEDAMSHFQDTKDKWERVVDEHGNVHWIDVSYLSANKPLPFWPFGDTSDFY